MISDKKLSILFGSVTFLIFSILEIALLLGGYYPKTVEISQYYEPNAARCKLYAINLMDQNSIRKYRWVQLFISVNATSTALGDIKTWNITQFVSISSKYNFTLFNDYSRKINGLCWYDSRNTSLVIFDLNITNQNAPFILGIIFIALSTVCLLLSIFCCSHLKKTPKESSVI